MILYCVSSFSYGLQGEYQLVIEHMEEAGFGALQRQFEQLKQKLTAEGLFDNQHLHPFSSSSYFILRLLDVAHPRKLAQLRGAAGICESCGCIYFC